MYKEGTRVKVWAGDGETYLGEGIYAGHVPLCFFAMPDGSLLSMHDAESPPPQDIIDELTGRGGVMVQSFENPKLVLDDGTVKYGCQTWWRPLVGGE